MHLQHFVQLAALAILAHSAPHYSPASYRSTVTTIDTVPAPEQQSLSTTGNTELVARLLTAPTAEERFKLLENDSDFVYDFSNPNGVNVTTTGDGGHTVKADRLAFPALTGTGVAMTLGFLGPCGFNTPHTHPRSSEINVVAEGELIAEFIPENGARIVRNHLTKFQMTVFPKGALHTEMNPLCTNSTFVAGFGDEDPGVQQAVQTLFGIDDDLVAAALKEGGTVAGERIEMYKSVVPANVAAGVEACLKRCGIQKK